MKLKIQKKILLKNLNNMSAALSGKNLVPIYSGIKFDLTKEGLTLTATDDNLSIQVFIKKDKEYLEIEETGSVVITGKVITDIVNKIDEEVLNIETIDDGKMFLSTKNSEFNFNGYNKDEYPNIDFELSGEKIEVESEQIKEMVNEISFATSYDEGRPVLTGINYKIVGNILECTATDSYRLARKIITLNDEIKENHNFIIPKRNLLEFNKIIDDVKEKVEIYVFNNKVIFKYKNVIYSTRLINGNYPNTSNLFSKESNFEIEVNRMELYNSIDRASIFSSDKDKNIISIVIKKDNMLIKSSSDEIGKVEEKIDIKNSGKEELEISFSSKYMMEALKSFKNEEIKLYFSEGIKPILLKDDKHENLNQLVLPFRTY